ncbi:MAG: hypothetical protein JWO13_2006 [Acidobacteriales bacterium]|nr:hypothetical protein [Terriglobales bacterium]
MRDNLKMSLSPEECALAIKGTLNIQARLSVYMSGITFSTPYPVFGWPKETGKYNEAAASNFQSLHQKLTSQSTGRKRVRLNVFELSALAFAVRFAKKKILHGEYKWEGSPVETLSEELLRSVAKCRKKAKRRFVSIQSKDEYIARRNEQQQLFLWLRIKVLYCWCKFRSPSKSQRYLRSIVKTLVAYAIEAIHEAGYRPLERSLLHKLIRLALREIRRDRVYLGIQEVLKNANLAKIHLLGFIEERCELEPIVQP